MNKFGKIAALSIAAMMGIGMLSGCGADKGGTLTMATNAQFPPFEFVTEEGKGTVGQFDGIDVVIADKIAQEAGKTLKVDDMSFEGIIASVASGKADMGVAGMTVTPERQQSVDFSDTYYTASQSIVVAPDNTNITKAEDLKNNKKIGVVLGYTGDTICTDDLGISDSNLLRVKRGIDAVQELKNGKLDAVVIDSATAKALSEKNGLKIVDDPEVFEKEEYAIAVKKGNQELLNTINKVLAEMKANGEIEKLAQKYN
jgi:ABC-type amino acid transport substrate-binding protein